MLKAVSTLIAPTAARRKKTQGKQTPNATAMASPAISLKPSVSTPSPERVRAPIRSL